MTEPRSIPVFDDERKIVGYLEIGDTLFKQLRMSDCVHLVLVPPLRDVRDFRELRDLARITSIDPEPRNVAMDWGMMGAQRDNTGCYEVSVLIVKRDDIALLDRLRGFRWFAEVHGEFFASQRARAL